MDENNLQTPIDRVNAKILREFYIYQLKFEEDIHYEKTRCGKRPYQSRLFG
jgi:hypothetical protein